LAERNQDVIGSDGRCHVPNNHSKYRTSGVPLLCGTPVQLHCQHGGTGIEPPNSLTRQAFYLHACGGEKRLYCPGRVRWRDTGQDNLPMRGLQPQRCWRHRQVCDLNHVDPCWQRSAQSVPHIVGIAAPGEGDLQVLGLAGRTRGCPAGVRDLGMR
jgi:hypothetical protein